MKRFERDNEEGVSKEEEEREIAAMMKQHKNDHSSFLHRQQDVGDRGFTGSGTSQYATYGLAHEAHKISFVPQPFSSKPSALPQSARSEYLPADASVFVVGKLKVKEYEMAHGHTLAMHGGGRKYVIPRGGSSTKDGCVGAFDFFPTVKCDLPPHILEEISKAKASQVPPKVDSIRPDKGQEDSFGTFFSPYTNSFVDKKDKPALTVGVVYTHSNIHPAFTASGDAYFKGKWNKVGYEDPKQDVSDESIFAYLATSGIVAKQNRVAFAPALQNFCSSFLDAQQESVEHKHGEELAEWRRGLQATIESVKHEKPTTQFDGCDPFALGYLQALYAISTWDTQDEQQSLPFATEVACANSSPEQQERYKQGVALLVSRYLPSRIDASYVPEKLVGEITKCVASESNVARRDRELGHFSWVKGPIGMCIADAKTDMPISAAVSKALIGRLATEDSLFRASFTRVASAFDRAASGECVSIISFVVDVDCIPNPSLVTKESGCAPLSKRVANAKTHVYKIAGKLGVRSVFLGRLVFDAVFNSARMAAAMYMPRVATEEASEQFICGGEILDPGASLLNAGVQISKECAARRLGRDEEGSMPKADDTWLKAVACSVDSGDLACVTDTERPLEYFVKKNMSFVAVMPGLRQAKLDADVLTLAGEKGDLSAQDALVDALAKDIESAAREEYVQSSNAPFGKLPCDERICVVFAMSPAYLYGCIH